ncbi:EscU/YscU/HrcU family type III secretion system export apparatus switch protein [Fervidobacterium sp. 2310opik-2]|uniref:EscU/YscU/HrcU family type III secretion system export apparatus switch protein n=1 Tax=Fervidobacterium sp. 2310opik-2 TaxID=1755815 RepID=UPI0019D02F53|nr:EscU/YscU/HrcU family type III secretion system export apparatus switch protein [Fervidobacterium sp. 2310opik-2]
MSTDMNSKDDCTEKLAVALKYQMGKDFAPFVVAKGRCQLAEAIVKKAEENNVPIVKSPDLVEELFRLDILEMIPSKLYVAVAEVLAFVQLQNRK